MSDPRILAFDTSAAHCAAALLCEGRIVDSRHEPLARGQAERLMPLLEEMLGAAGLAWADLDAIGVGIGPGNFTGIRISVAAARGLALAMGRPALGVSGFEALRSVAPGVRLQMVSLAGPRGTVYIQRFADGAVQGPPRQIDPQDPPDDLGITSRTQVLGAEAERLAQGVGAQSDATTLADIDIAAAIARCAARTLEEAPAPYTRPAPLYVRAADAAPPRDAPPALLP